MRNSLPWSGRAALLLLLPAALLPLLLAGPQSSERVPPRSSFHDWTTRHALYPHIGTLAALEAVRSDPRARFRWQEIEQQSQLPSFVEPRSFAVFPWRRFPRRFPPRFPGRNREPHTDWSIVLGTGTTAAGQYPAKFAFDTTAPPSCINDFVVFPVNVNGSAGQPNLVGLNNLYSGIAGSAGICNRPGVANANDSKTGATVLWSYNVHAIAAGGAVPTSPVLSLDGTRVVFVESAAGNAAHFHVLAWKSGDGQNVNLQTTTSPKAIAAFSATAPAAGTGTATDLQLGALTTGTDTLSSPFIDYVRDRAYVGNDIGILYRIKNVFCTTPACSGGGSPAPSLDATWGIGGAVTVPCGLKLTGPVLDFVTLNVYVGCADGKVYGFNSSGAPLATASLAVGDGSATGAIVESPIVDGVNGFIYAVAGTGVAPNTTHAVLVQFKTDLSAPRVATVGVFGRFNLHAPAFNDPYFSSATSTTWLVYVGAYDATGANLTLYAPTFDVARNMTAGAPANFVNIGTRPGEYAPLTEFKNTNDLLFIGVLVSPPDMAVMNINAFPGGPPGTLASQGTLGVSGMVIDNSSASAQASSIYFGTLGTTHTAVKLTQAGFQ